MTRGEIESLLRFYNESGLDFPIGDSAIDNFEQSASAAPETKKAPPAETPPAPAARPLAIPDADAVALAVKAASNAQSLDALKQAVETFEGCNLRHTARSTVFEGGNRDASVMMISDAPGRDDDANGVALSGPEGQLFDRMLAAIGLSRDDVYLGFAVPWRVPGNTTPSQLQAAICKPFADRQIELAKPEIVVLLGNGAARVFLGGNKNILQMRGEWKSLKTAGGFEIPVIATLQPRYLLEQPAQKRFAWIDLLAIEAHLASSRRDDV
jgi:uracil-DNA glycosylase family 4